MRDALDTLIPLFAFPLVGAAIGALVSIAAGGTDLAATIGALTGIGLMILLGVLLPPEPGG